MIMVGRKTYDRQAGFTIVELLVVIVVIAVLAAIVVVAYNGLQQRAREASLKSDLTGAAKKMALACAENTTCPTALPSDVKVSSGNALSLSVATGGYCVNGYTTSGQTLSFNFNSISGGLQAGLCSGAVIAGSETGVNPNLITNTDFTSGWNLSIQVSTGRTLTTRAGTAGDPYPNRPVLVVTNNGTAATSWAVVQTNQLNYTAITAGKTYVRSFYVRKTGAATSGTTGKHPGVLDGDNTHITFSSSIDYTATSNWQYFSSTAAASQNAPSTNYFYAGLTTTPFTTSGWTLEFQGFDLHEQ